MASWRRPRQRCTPPRCSVGRLGVHRFAGQPVQVQRHECRHRLAGLVLVSKTAQKLVAIDTRGGYFSQDDIETPLTALLSEEKWNAAVTQLAAKQDLSRQAYIADQAYVLRVQLSHIRIKKAQYDKLPAGIDDGSSTSHPPALVEVYKLFTAQSTKRNLSNSTYTKSKFPNLAHLQVLQDEADGPSSSDEDITVVWQGWETCRNRCIRRLSNGYAFTKQKHNNRQQ